MQVDPTHNVLKAHVKDGNVVLTCPDCDYIQTSIPALFSEENYDEAYNEQRKMMESLKNHD